VTAITVTRISSSPLATARPSSGSIDATLERLADEPWWSTIRELPTVGTALRGQIVCLGHFLAWLDARHTRILDCTDEQLVAYDRSVSRFRPGEAYRRTARRFVELALVWQACQPRGSGTGASSSPARGVVAR
jgi:hypothetical protein